MLRRSLLLFAMPVALLSGCATVTPTPSGPARPAPPAPWPSDESSPRPVREHAAPGDRRRVPTVAGTGDATPAQPRHHRPTAPLRLVEPPDDAPSQPPEPPPVRPHPAHAAKRPSAPAAHGVPDTGRMRSTMRPDVVCDLGDQAGQIYGDWKTMCKGALNR